MSNRLVEKQMETPTLEEVREYFKNAKNIVCVNNGKAYNITTGVKQGIHIHGKGYWMDLDCSIHGIYDVKLWSELRGYAEIVEYINIPVPIAHYDNTAPKIDPIVTSVMTQLLTRSQLGISKYGTTLEDNNTDDFLQHLKEELMDAILYIEKLQSNEK